MSVLKEGEPEIAVLPPRLLYLIISHLPAIGQNAQRKSKRKYLKTPPLSLELRGEFRVLYNKEDGPMSNTAVQLELYQAILAVIERKRAETGDEQLGASIERVILDTQFQELEHEILDNPGAFEPWLIRRRRPE